MKPRFLPRAALATVCFGAILTGCSVETSTGTPPVQRKTEEVDPVELSIAESGDIYTHANAIPVNMAEGAFEFRILQPARTDIQLLTLQPSVESCEAKQVSVQAIWFQSVDQKMGRVVAVGDTFTALAGIKGRLQIQFKNITGCTKVGYSISLAKPKSWLGSEVPGTWMTSETSATETPHQFKMEVVKHSEDDFAVSISISCQASGTETFAGQLVPMDSSASPKRLLVHITAVNSAAASFCNKQLGVSPSYVGHYLSCIYERQSDGGPFRLACKKTMNTADFPLAFESVTTSWRRP